MVPARADSRNVTLLSRVPALVLQRCWLTGRNVTLTAAGLKSVLQNGRRPVVRPSKRNWAPGRRGVTNHGVREWR